MTNPFALTPLHKLSNVTLQKSAAVYRRFLLELGQFSDSAQMQGIRVQVQDALAELADEVENRTFVLSYPIPVG